MSDCNTIRRLITEAVLGDLSAADESRLGDHLERCDDCRAVLRDGRRAAAVYGRHAVPHLPENYWAEFAARLENRITAEEAKRRRPHAAERRRRQAAVPLGVAAAVVLFALGILVGRATVDDVAQDEAVSSAGMAAVADAALEQYLTRAQTLFLSLSNSVPTGSGPVASSAEKQAAERLIRDTRMLKTAMDGTDDPMLSNLIDDVELVLLQYTNVGTPEKAREALDELGLLLRINLYTIDRNRNAVPVHL